MGSAASAAGGMGDVAGAAGGSAGGAAGSAGGQMAGVAGGSSSIYGQMADVGGQSGSGVGAAQPTGIDVVSGANTGVGPTNTGNTLSNNATEMPTWYDKISGMVKDYSKGNNGTMSDAINGNAMTRVGYGMNKVQSMAGSPSAPPQIQLPQVQNRPASPYRSLYEKMMAQQGR